MTPFPLETFWFCAYVLAGPIAWGLLGFVLLNGHRKLKLLERPYRPLPESPPHVTILIPAKDEAQRIGACLESALSQDYPSFDVIAIDDRSTDETGRILDALSAANPALTALHIPAGAPPAGWTGKCNALRTGVSAARGDYLLFVDSDVVLSPECTRAMMGMACAKRTRLLSFFPRLESHTFWEGLIVPLAGAALSVLYTVSWTNEDDRGAAFANGQVMLFQRQSYDAIGGHEAVRDRFCEDIDFARLSKGQGHKTRLAVAPHLAAVRMYSSAAAIIRGFARIFFAASLARPGRILTGAVAVMILMVLPHGVLAWGAWEWIFLPDRRAFGIPCGGYWTLLAAIQFIMIRIILGRVYHWTGNRTRYAWGALLGAGGLLAIFAKALRMCRTGQVVWRGTAYGGASAPPRS